MKRIIDAVCAFWYVVTTGKSLFPVGDSDNNVEAIASEEEKLTELPSDNFNDGAVYTLALLQREGRLVDFLLEDIENYSNEQIGAAVRQIHRNCRSVLSKYFSIQHIMSDKEGESISIANDYDPLTIKLLGNVQDSFPQKGQVKHQGWKADAVSFPEFSGQRNPLVVQPSEIEIK